MNTTVSNDLSQPHRDNVIQANKKHTNAISYRTKNSKKYKYWREFFKHSKNIHCLMNGESVEDRLVQSVFFKFDFSHIFSTVCESDLLLCFCLIK